MTPPSGERCNAHNRRDCAKCEPGFYPLVESTDPLDMRNGTVGHGGDSNKAYNPVEEVKRTGGY